MDSERRVLEDPLARLEQAFIDEYIRSRGYDPVALKALSEDQRHRLLREASAYAGAKLAEVEARAHYVHEIHGER